jgi:hypothetical protein
MGAASPLERLGGKARGKAWKKKTERNKDGKNTQQNK